MLSVLLSWIILFFVFLFMGEVVIRAWNYFVKAKVSYSIFDKFWIGLSSLGVILLYLSIFTSLNIWIVFALLLFSLIFWLSNIPLLKETVKRAKQTISSFTKAEKVILILSFIAIALYAICAPRIHDEGLYHLQTMQWAQKFEVIPGLGNLHGRLAFNSSFLLLSSLFNYHPAYFETFFTINSLSLLILSCWLVYQLVRTKVFLVRATISFLLVFSIFTLGADVASTSTDILPSILIIYLLTSLSLEDKPITSKILRTVLLASFCITLKLSAAMIVLAVLVSLFILLREKQKKLAFIIASIGILIAIPWLTRFVILSGYLIYPFPSIDIFHFDWKIPVEMVNEEIKGAYVWARAKWIDADELLSMSFFQWLPIWFANLSLYKKTFYILTAISPIILFFYKYILDKKKITIWLLALCGVVFSLTTAPDFRFTFGFIISTISLAILALSDKLKLQVHILNKCSDVAVIIASIGLIYIAVTQINFGQTDSSRGYASLVYKPQPIDLFNKGFLYGRDVDIEFEKYKMGDIDIYVPKNTDQCFDQQIPCTPYYSTNLELRGDKLEDGFRIKR